MEKSDDKRDTRSESPSTEHKNDRLKTELPAVRLPELLVSYATSFCRLVVYKTDHNQGELEVGGERGIER